MCHISASCSIFPYRLALSDGRFSLVITAKNLIFALFIMMTLDFKGDAILRAFPVNMFFWADVTQLVIVSSVLISFLAFGLKLPREQNLLVPFFLVIIVLLLGLFNGLMTNEYGYAISEAIPFFFFLSFLGFNSLKDPISVLEIEKFFKIFAYIILLKITVYSFSAYIFSGALSWKVLLKQTPYMLIPLSFYLSKIKFNSMTGSNYLSLFILCFALIFAMSRMMIIATIFILILTFFNKHFFRAFKILAPLSIVFVIYQFLIGSSGLSIMAFFYGGEVYEHGLNYRLVQLDVILDRLSNSPLWGVGFGYFTAGYLDYYLLAKPYLLELDILNFISKIGLIGLIIYVFAYLKLYQLIKAINDYSVQKVAIALFLGMLGVIVYSLGQTAHQSYFFWIFFAFLYGFVVSHLRAQSKASKLLVIPPKNQTIQK